MTPTATEKQQPQSSTGESLAPMVQNAMVSLVCDHPLVTEAFYTKYFGFRRARVYLPGQNQVVVLKAGTTYLQIFPAFEMRPPCLDAPSKVATPYPGGRAAGPLYTGLRKLTFLVENVEAQLAYMGNDARITQSMRPGLIPGSKSVWIADPSGNVIELIEGYCDDPNPPPCPSCLESPTPLWLRRQDIGPVVQAARTGDLAMLNEWLLTSGNPNQYDTQGWTPLLAAAVRGRTAAVDLLLNNHFRRADPEISFLKSGALPIHFAGQSGSIDTARLLLDACPDHLERIWELNGHTLLLQAVFYGHLELVKFALQRGASTAATTVRGLAAMELAQQFQNQPLMNLISPFDSPPDAKMACYRYLLQLIAPFTPPSQAAAQQLSDSLVRAIEDGLKSAAQKPGSVETTFREVRDLVERQNVDVNRLGGPLQQPPLVVVVTGTNGSPPNENVVRLRKQLAGYLLEKGADPTKCEKHPMAVHAIIRAAVFNHLEVLRMIAERMTPQSLTAALNEQPVFNGLTALHDTVLQASTAGPDRLQGYLDQIRWCVANGARTDIEDFSGRTQRSIAEETADPKIRQRILEALGV